MPGASPAAQITIQSSQATPMEVATHVYPREKPGWMAIALIVAFVLGAVALYLAGAYFVSRAAGNLSSVAVLPFTGLGSEPLGVTFARRLTDDLASVEGLHVFTPDGTTGQRIGSVVEGSVLKTGDRLHVTARLVQAANRRVLWAHSYDCEGKDVDAVQAEIVRAIVSTLRHHSAGQLPHR